jgi:hypothetical protein
MMALAESLRDFIGQQAQVDDARRHLDATMSWLCRAQDADGDGGVARMYDLRRGWGASYPETTGYIIPTFLHYARLSGNGDFRARALRMADWECQVQMPEGAVQGGTIDHPPTPAVFNTGQVVFGWCAAFRAAGDERYLASARRAVTWLCDNQDQDGLWRRNLSRFCSAATDTYAYNARTAWAMLEYAALVSDAEATACAERNITAVCALAHDNGWVAKNCLDDPLRPLLHTIAYTQQGLFEAGLKTGNERALQIVLEGSGQLRRQFERRGVLAGRYTQDWRQAVRWRCLTGEAQTAIVWQRIAAWNGDAQWRDAAERLTEAVCATQRIDAAPAVAGGVKGSFPVYGGYGQYQYLNWAAKFLADALMLKLGDPFVARDG